MWERQGGDPRPGGYLVDDETAKRFLSLYRAVAKACAESQQVPTTADANCLSFAEAVVREEARKLDQQFIEDAGGPNVVELYLAGLAAVREVVKT
jgi:hypothetical protein